MRIRLNKNAYSTTDLSARRNAQTGINMTHNIYIYLTIMAGVTYAIRTLPLTLIRKQIKNKFFKSFLYYVPYVTLAVMTFPAIMDATQSPVAGIAALLVGIAAAWLGAGLFPVSVLCCLTVFLLELFLV